MVKTASLDVVRFLMEYEEDLLNEEEVIKGFQALINYGVVWSLQGSYGRMAKSLIESGHCTAAHSTRKE